MKYRLDHIFMRPEEQTYSWIENFLIDNDFKRLWIKSFSIDIKFIEIFKEHRKNDCDVKILIDNTQSRYSDKTPFERLKEELELNSQRDIEKRYFPILPGNLHNKYMYFKKNWEKGT